MSAYLVGEIAGALVPTLLVSRLLLWLSKWWDGGMARLLLVHFVSASAGCTISAFGHADGGPLDWSRSGTYILAQAVWLVVDILRQRRARSSATQ